jgi:hypothetical protein
VPLPVGIIIRIEISKKMGKPKGITENAQSPIQQASKLDGPINYKLLQLRFIHYQSGKKKKDLCAKSYISCFASLLARVTRKRNTETLNLLLLLHRKSKRELSGIQKKRQAR